MPPILVYHLQSPAKAWLATITFGASNFSIVDDVVVASIRDGFKSEILDHVANSRPAGAGSFGHSPAGCRQGHVLSSKEPSGGRVLATGQCCECLWLGGVWRSDPSNGVWVTEPRGERKKKGSHSETRFRSDTNECPRLSITEWRPVTGSLPPLSSDDWEAEFQKYRASPEFKLLNPNMTLPEFQKIYYMEWTHRQWGRLVGMTFLLPTAYFILRRRVTRSMAARLVGISGLIAFQGVLGWWMVKSGLVDDLFAAGSHPRVSQYRLTAHLGTAFVCYTAMLWNGLQVLRERGLVNDLGRAASLLETLRHPSLRVFRGCVGALAGLVFLTAMSGGLVAGLDAGLIYNDFPYMGVGFTPPRSELFSDFYARRADRSDLWWRNMLENPSTVQLDHRILATSTFTAVMALWALSRFSPRLRKRLPKDVGSAVNHVVYLVWLQVILGISTLIYMVPVPLAATHQAGSLALLSGVVVLASRLTVPAHVRHLSKQIKHSSQVSFNHLLTPQIH